MGDDRMTTAEWFTLVALVAAGIIAAVGIVAYVMENQGLIATHERENDGATE